VKRDEKAAGCDRTPQTGGITNQCCIGVVEKEKKKIVLQGI
jgi:hypothetical protein